MSVAATGVHSGLLRLDLRIRLAVEAFRAQLAQRAADPFRGLYVAEHDVDELLEATPPAELARQLLAGEVAQVSPRLEQLAQLFNLSAFETEALLVCLAPDVDLRYERLYGYLQDDVTRKRPTPDLVLRLLQPPDVVEARASLGAGGRPQREWLIAPVDESASSLPLLARPLRLEERVVEFLLGSDLPDPRILAFAEVTTPETGPRSPVQSPPQLTELLRDHALDAHLGPLVYLHGPPTAAKRTAIQAACRAAQQPVVIVDLAALLAHSRPTQAVSWVMREATLQGAVLALDGIESVLSDQPEAAAVRAVLRRALMQRRGPTLMLGEARWEPAVWLAGLPTLMVELTLPGPAARRELWHSYLNGSVPAEQVTELAARYRFGDDGIRAALASARGRSVWRGEPDFTPGDLRAAARAIAAPPLEGLARLIEPRYDWNDIVLAADGLAQLKELCARARHQGLVLDEWGYGRKHVRRAGLTALFAGPPGTGKTMAAEIIAGGLGLELYRIDLSAVVSKYIGETEKNLEKIFRAADQGDAVLLFDEADALFGKRSEVRDAHDRYANVEVAYLLQRLEAYEGVAVLTTNLRGNVDEAFLRRLDCVLEFPVPEEAERLAIWRRSIPAEAPLSPDVDLPFLARKFKLAGGHIRNIALSAAFLAASDAGQIGMKHIARATRREYQKLGKLVAPGDFEHYYDLLKE